MSQLRLHQVKLMLYQIRTVVIHDHKLHRHLSYHSTITPSTIEGHSVERMYLRQTCFDGWVIKTILKPRLTERPAANIYTWDFSDVKFRVAAPIDDIGESNPVPASDYNLDRAQKLISSSMSRHLSTRNILSKSMLAFLSNLANRETDRQTRAKTFTSSFVGCNNNLHISQRSCDTGNVNVRVINVNCLCVAVTYWNSSQCHSKVNTVANTDGVQLGISATSVILYCTLKQCTTSAKPSVQA